MKRMINVFKSRYLRREFTAVIAAAALLTLAGFIADTRLGIFALISGAVFSALHLYFAYRNIKRIDELSRSVDRILYGQESVLFSDQSEGELAILKSEIHKMTVRLKSQADQLRDDKIMISDAVADISHQMRTPLTAMNLAVSMLSDSRLPDDRQTELTHQLKKQLERIDWLVETLLKISRIDAGTVVFRKEPVSVKELVNSAISPLMILMDIRDIRLVTEIGGESFTGDFSWMRESIGNILKNCVEHTPCGGTIEISAQDTPLFTEIKISDTGNGFAKEDIPHLFERFYKGKNTGEGNIGIGLALSRMIIAEHNGTITASNGEQGGAVFTIKLYKSVV